MIFPWYTTMMLAFESNSVIQLRLAKIGRGGSHAQDEASLMFREKADAGLECLAAVMKGQTYNGVVDLYRGHVAANEARLSQP